MYDRLKHKLLINKKIQLKICYNPQSSTSFDDGIYVLKEKPLSMKDP